MIAILKTAAMSNRALARALAVSAAISLTAATASAEPPQQPSVQQEELAALRAQVQAQADLIAAQQRAIAELSGRLDQIEKGQHLPQASPAVQHAAGPGVETTRRDSVGDLNAGVVEAGSFAGSILLPGTEGVSLAVGGFVKAAVIADSAAETMGADFLPANLGASSPDTAGNFAIDSTITRLHMDGRARTPAGAVRGYVEYDLNATNSGALGFKLRHAYGSWTTAAGTLTAGHTWSTSMDLRILPEGLTEPTVSGAIFQRQSIARWSFPSVGGVTAHVAIEDPSGTDIFTNQTPTARTTLPDAVGAVELDRERFHVRAGALLRRLEVQDDESGLRTSAVGWGTALTGRVALAGGDSMAASLAYGEGAGRYLLGLFAGSGAILDPDLRVRKREAFGALVWYRHAWTSAMRSTIGVGHAASELFPEQPGEAFRSSTYAYSNWMWSAMRFATFGVEYAFGRRTSKDTSFLDNHRLVFGVQVF